jgi:putative transcriptional regulator
MIRLGIRLGVVIAALVLAASARAQEKLAPARGVFLVAKSEIQDGPFYQSVVLLLAHSDKGSLGLIVNRPTEVPVSEALPELGGKTAHELYYGGPIALDGLLFLVRSDHQPRPPRPPGPSWNAERVLDDVDYSGDRTLLDELMRLETKSDALRLFIGHSGWAPGQLDAELARGSWDVVQADAATVFTKEPKLMWLELSRDSRLMARSRSSRLSRPSSRSARAEVR